MTKQSDKRPLRVKAFDAADHLLCLLEALDIKSASMENVTEEMLDAFIERNRELWTKGWDKHCIR